MEHIKATFILLKKFGIIKPLPATASEEDMVKAALEEQEKIEELVALAEIEAFEGYPGIDLSGMEEMLEELAAKEIAAMDELAAMEEKAAIESWPAKESSRLEEWTKDDIAELEALAAKEIVEIEELEAKKKEAEMKEKEASRGVIITYIAADQPLPPWEVPIGIPDDPRFNHDLSPEAIFRVFNVKGLLLAKLSFNAVLVKRYVPSMHADFCNDVYDYLMGSTKEELIQQFLKLYAVHDEEVLDFAWETLRYKAKPWYKKIFNKRFYSRQ